MPDRASVDFALPDVNVLVALTNPAHQHHRLAHRWLAEVPTFATTPITENGLLRLLLNSTVTGQPVSSSQALAILRGVRADRRATFIPDSTSLAAATIDLIGLAGHRQVTDLYLVDVVAACGGVLVTFDRRISTVLAQRDRHLVQIL